MVCHYWTSLTIKFFDSWIWKCLTILFMVLAIKMTNKFDGNDMDLNLNIFFVWFRNPSSNYRPGWMNSSISSSIRATWQWSEEALWKRNILTSTGFIPWAWKVNTLPGYVVSTKVWVSFLRLVEMDCKVEKI
jgi:hypothetical protein